jgi:hypothetical protein
VIATYALIFIYSFYYGFGDTITYFKTSSLLTEAIQLDYSRLVDFFLNKQDIFLDKFKDVISTTGLYEGYFGAEGLFVLRFCVFIQLFIINDFFCVALIFSFLAYLGTWLLYHILVKFFQTESQLLLLLFILPSFVFWSSGILKDSLCIFFLGMLIRSVSLLSEYRSFQSRIVLVATSFLWLFCIWELKFYIVLSLLLALIVSIFVYFILSDYSVNRKLLGMFILGMIGFYVWSHFLNGFAKLLDLQTLIALIQQNQRGFVSSTQEGGAVFSLGEIEPSIKGVLSVVPKAIFAVYFRPFVWETRNVLALLSALESLAILLLVLKAVIGISRKKLLNLVRYNPMLIFTFAFCIIYAAAIGLNITNFGALVRFKIYTLPFLLAIIGCLRSAKKSPATDL